MKQKNIKKILINELNYTKYEAEVTSADLIKLDQSLQPALLLWLKDRTVSDLKMYDFSVLKLMEEKKFTFPASLIALDWLIKDPETARKALLRM
jgi:hypothetical protein